MKKEIVSLTRRLAAAVFARLAFAAILYLAASATDCALLKCFFPQSLRNKN